MSKKTKITVVGAGYVGMSLSILLAQYNDVVILDIDQIKIANINKGNSSIKDEEIDSFLVKNNLSFKATDNIEEAYIDSDFIIIATPTNYNTKLNKFDTSIVDKAVSESLNINDKALIIIKSTLPIGHTQYLQEKFSTSRIIFSPEFLREGKALHDNLYPSRIVIGGLCKQSKEFLKLIKQATYKKNVINICMSSSEAEAVKLFSNSYLAMRVSFFNELDSLAMSKDLNTKNIIKGVCSDKRIGADYNNPSFGYGGYCLPKDTKQLVADYDGLPNELIQAVVSSNNVRMDTIFNKIISLKPKILGIHRLTMKEGSDNFRSSATINIMEKIISYGLEIVIYEPLINDEFFLGCKVIKNLNIFKKTSSIIMANRNSDQLNDVKAKVFTRDIFNEN